MNARLFPKSSNAWDSLAEVYTKAGLKNSEKEYKKSLALDSTNENRKALLKKVQEAK